MSVGRTLLQFTVGRRSVCLRFHVVAERQAALDVRTAVLEGVDLMGSQAFG